MRPQGRSTILENAGRVEVMTFLPWFALVKQGHPTPKNALISGFARGLHVLAQSFPKPQTPRMKENVPADIRTELLQHLADRRAGVLARLTEHGQTAAGNLGDHAFVCPVDHRLERPVL